MNIKTSLFVAVIIGFIFISGCIKGPITGEWASVANKPGIIIFYDNNTFSIVSLDTANTEPQYGGTYLIDDSKSPRQIVIHGYGTMIVQGNKFGEGIPQQFELTLVGTIDSNNNEIILYNEPNAIPARFIYRRLAT